jgi:hypothetical protein
MRATSVWEYTIFRLKQTREDLHHLRKVVNVAELTYVDIIAIEDTAHDLASEIAVFLVWLDGLDAGLEPG